MQATAVRGLQRWLALMVPLLIVAMTGACRLSPASARLDAVRLDDEMSRRGVDSRLHPNPLAVTDEMQRVVTEVMGIGSPLERLRRLHEWLFATDSSFDYDSDATLTAIAAYESRSGNCVSFTTLFIALSRSANLDVRAALRTSGESGREGDLIVVNDHIVAAYLHGGGATVFDFNLDRREPSVGLQLISDLWIAAIHLNNHGVRALIEGDTKRALDRLKTAVALAPGFAPPWGNIGVVRRHRADLDGAFDAYRRALEIDPRSPTVLNNLAALYMSLARKDEAIAALRAARLRDTGPYTLLVLGEFELQDGRVRAALRLYRRAAALDPSIPEAQLAIARAELARGRRKRALTAVARALMLDPDNEQAQAARERIAR